MSIKKRFLLLFMFSSFMGKAQNDEIIIELVFILLKTVAEGVVNNISTNLVAHDGFIVTNSNDTLKGLVQLNIPTTKTVKLYTPNKDSIINISTISMIRINNYDSSFAQTNYTDFVRFKKNPFVLYRKIFSGSFELYDNCNYVNEKISTIGSEFIVTKFNKPDVKINPPFSAKRELIDFINLHYHKQFKKSDFPRKVDVIKWLQKNDS
jgi:hypothetical protein